MVKSQRQMSRGPAWVAGALLILQGVGLMGIGAYFFGRIDWDRALVVTNGQGLIDVQTVDGPWLEPLEQAALFATYSASLSSGAGDGCSPSPLRA
jgi:hypothetical protein